MALTATLIQSIKLFDSSGSDDSTDEEEEYVFFCIKNKCSIPRARCKNYMEIVDSFTDDEFKCHFRMKQSTFKFLLNLLRPELSRKDKRYGRHPVSPEKQLLIAIWFMSTPNAYRCISDRFDVGIATAWRSVHKVVNALYDKVKTFIRWPILEECQQSIETVQRNYGFPGVIGAIDGTHVKIIVPRKDSDSYINKKEFHFIQLQCYAGQVGSVHDMRTFRLSNFERMCTDNHFPLDSHILGDAAYRLTKYIMEYLRTMGIYLNVR